MGNCAGGGESFLQTKITSPLVSFDKGLQDPHRLIGIDDAFLKPAVSGFYA